MGSLRNSTGSNIPALKRLFGGTPFGTFLFGTAKERASVIGRSSSGTPSGKPSGRSEKTIGAGSAKARRTTGGGRGTSVLRKSKKKTLLGS